MLHGAVASSLTYIKSGKARKRTGERAIGGYGGDHRANGRAAASKHELQGQEASLLSPVGKLEDPIGRGRGQMCPGADPIGGG